MKVFLVQKIISTSHTPVRMSFLNEVLNRFGVEICLTIKLEIKRKNWFMR